MVALGLLGGILLILQARILSQVIAAVFLGAASPGEVFPPLRLLLVIFTGRALFALVCEVCANRAALQIKTQLRQQLLDHLFILGPAYVHGERTGELVTTAMDGIEALDAYYSQYLPQLFLAALLPLIILVMVFPLDALTAIILLVTAPLMPVFMLMIGGLSETATHRQWAALTRLGAHFLDTLQGLTTLKLLGQSRARAAGLARSGERYLRATVAVLRVTFLSALVLEWVATLSTAVVAVEIGLRLLHGGFTYPQALFILVLAPEFYMPLRVLGMRFHAGMGGMSAAKRIAEVMATSPEVAFRCEGEVGGKTSPTSPSPMNGEGEKPSPLVVFSRNGEGRKTSPPVAPDWNGEGGRKENLFSICFENVSYAYPEAGQGEREALRNVSFEINPGENVAVVGASGAGKSTLIQLLMRFIVPEHGCILVNGLPLGDIPPARWRQRVAWVPQIPYLFNDTLQANLCLGKPDASPAQIDAALHLAHLDDFAHSLPDGLATIIGENGVRLSGGQAQRLALGRAYLKNAPLFLLDEPGANLDPQQETLLHEALASFAQGATVLTIAHRQNFVRQADRVIFLAHGWLVESGTHLELMAHNAAYAALWQNHV